jgi:hypothetical protein
MKNYIKTGITETGITGVGTRDAGTSEFSNLKTGITGGFPFLVTQKKPENFNSDQYNCIVCFFFTLSFSKKNPLALLCLRTKFSVFGTCLPYFF